MTAARYRLLRGGGSATFASLARTPSATQTPRTLPTICRTGPSLTDVRCAHVTRLASTRRRHHHQALRAFRASARHSPRRRPHRPRRRRASSSASTSSLHAIGVSTRALSGALSSSRAVTRGPCGPSPSHKIRTLRLATASIVTFRTLACSRHGTPLKIIIAARAVARVRHACQLHRRRSRLHHPHPHLLLFPTHCRHRHCHRRRRSCHRLYRHRRPADRASAGTIGAATGWEDAHGKRSAMLDFGMP